MNQFGSSAKPGFPGKNSGKHKTDHGDDSPTAPDIKNWLFKFVCPTAFVLMSARFHILSAESKREPINNPEKEFEDPRPR